jgi:hypothetical protein
MTLVIMFENAPIMVSDVLLSNREPKFFDKLPLRVFEQDGTPRYSGRLVQKIIRIQDGLHIACAGTRSDAKKIIDFARSLHWPSVPTGELGRAEIEPLIDKIKKYYEDEELTPLQLIIFANGSCRFGIKVNKVQTPVGPTLVIGEGTDDFRKFAQRPFNLNRDHLVFPGQECVVFALYFFARHLLAERSEGGGGHLRNAWGLGMEMLRGASKVDRILYQAFLWDKSDDETEPRFEQWGDKIFSYYRGEHLIGLRQRADGSIRIAFRAAPLNEDYNTVGTLKDAPDSPQLTCTLFIKKSDFTVSPNIRYVEAGDSVCSISIARENGVLIAYSTEEVSKRFAETFTSP